MQHISRNLFASNKMHVSQTAGHKFPLETMRHTEVVMMFVFLTKGLKNFEAFKTFKLITLRILTVLEVSDLLR